VHETTPLTVPRERLPDNEEEQDQCEYPAHYNSSSEAAQKTLKESVGLASNKGSREEVERLLGGGWTVERILERATSTDRKNGGHFLIYLRTLKTVWAPRPIDKYIAAAVERDAEKSQITPEDYMPVPVPSQFVTPEQGLKLVSALRDRCSGNGKGGQRE
jgi:hypothetical protein